MGGDMCFGWDDFRRATKLAAPWTSTCEAGGWFPLDQPLPRIRRCCYIVVSQDRELLYIGRVRRSDVGGLRARFSNHHPQHDGWHAVWVLPLDHDAPSVAVDQTEAILISVFAPPENATAPSLYAG
jgi:hypothetical protein